MSKRNKDQEEKVIMAFMEAVYPENAELAMTSFNEIKTLQDATAELTSLRAEVERLKARLAEEIKWGHRVCTPSNCLSSGVDCPATNNKKEMGR